MATSSTLRVVHPEIAVTGPVETHESRFRRLFRRKSRRRRAAVLMSGWREEATLRGITRMGA
jgi:hypothetical protein